MACRIEWLPEGQVILASGFSSTVVFNSSPIEILTLSDPHFLKCAPVNAISSEMLMP